LKEAKLHRLDLPEPSATDLIVLILHLASCFYSQVLLLI
jgi:hypothetical protein